MIRSKSWVPKASMGRPRAVVVTGASSGIGRASAMKLARSGFRVFGLQGKFDARPAEGGRKTRPAHHAAKGR